MNERLSAAALYRALPHDRERVETWMREQLGDEMMSRTLAATPVPGGLDLELIELDERGWITLDDRGDVVVRFEFRATTDAPPPAWRRAFERGQL